MLLAACIVANCNSSKEQKSSSIIVDKCVEINSIKDVETIEEAIESPQTLMFAPPVISEDYEINERVITMDELASSSTNRESITTRTEYARLQLNTEQYPTFNENKFQLAKDVPLSTFSIDVDAASYSNMRRFINQGQLPPSDALRIEEMINYFSYNYNQPEGSDPVNILTEVGECPWNKKHRLVKIGLKAKEIESSKLPVSNFVFLIDVSGSMRGGNRIELVKSSLKLLLNNLRAEDKVAIVTYAGNAELLMPPTSGADKQKIREVINNLQVGGWTDGGSGMQLAYDVARKNFVKDGNNRIIMCSDGDFNVGAQSDNDLQTLVEKERKSGVFLSMLGYGMGNYKDDKMQTIAQAGNGNHAYIDNLQEANKVLVNEFGSTMYTVAKDVKLQLEFNPSKVQAYRLVGYETRLLRKEDFNNDAIDAGEMGAGHTVTAMYEVIPVGVQSNFVGSVDALKYQKEQNTESLFNTSPEMLTVKLRYKQPDGDTSKLMLRTLIDAKNDRVSDDFKFASSVAMFGQLLKESDYKGTASYDEVIALATDGLGKDQYGYKKEFIRLVESTKGLQ